LQTKLNPRKTTNDWLGLHKKEKWKSFLLKTKSKKNNYDWLGLQEKEWVF
jgi:hypothetical protein